MTAVRRPGRRSRPEAIALLCVVSVAVGAGGCGSAAGPDSHAATLAPVEASGPSGAAGDSAEREASEPSTDWASLNGTDEPSVESEMTFSVDADSDACAVALPFHPPGCTCKLGEKAKCWTGPPGLRGLPGCQDGEQECEGVEFGTWGACHDVVLDCMVPDEEEPEDPPPPEQECGCVPGTVITCSEDCSEFIICSLTGTKVCQPDGTWSACRENDLDALGQASFCRSMFYGCFPDNSPGVFIGDCGAAFTCGTVPPALNLGPPAIEPPVMETPGAPD